MFSGQKAAGGKDIFPAGSPDGGRDAQPVQLGLELLQAGFRCRFIREIRDAVEADEVDAALQAAEKPRQLMRVAGSVVPAFEQRVFETDAPLAGEVVLPDEFQHVLDGPGPLDRHQFLPLFGERVVEADGEMAFAFVQEAPELRHHPDGAERDALGAPAEPPVRREDRDSPLDGFPVVQRLPHAHEDGIGELPRLPDGEELVEDVRLREVAMEALPARHAEMAAHLAARLRAHAEGLALPVRNHHRLDGVPAGQARDREKVLPGAVGRFLHVDGGHAAGLAALFQGRPPRLGEIGHLIQRGGPVHIEPLGQLLARKGRQAQLQGQGLELFRRFPQQALRHGF